MIAISRRIHLPDTARKESNWGESERMTFTRKVLDAYNLAQDQGYARAYGHALALVNEWPTQYEPPPLLRIVKAALLQRTHDFGAARGELELALNADPEHQQALLMLAQIGLVTGDYGDVAEYCERLSQQPFLLAALNCRAQLQGLTGDGDAALSMLQSALALPSVSRLDARELHTTAATIAHRLGYTSIAESHYQQAFRLGNTSHYFLSNYAQWLLEQQRYGEAEDLLSSFIDGEDAYELMIFYFQSIRHSSPEMARQFEQQALTQAIQFLSRRADDRPHKVLARYALIVANDAATALTEAQLNWQQQKEPSDTLLLAQAAVLVEDIATIEQVRQWQKTTGQEDLRLDSLLVAAEQQQ
ncbi:MAG: hypothetical protein RIK09_16190 [Gammaproteobacteria bacterium]